MKLSTHIYAILLMLFVGLTATACGEKAIGVACITSEDCLFGQQCIEEYCQDVGDSGDSSGDTGNSADSVDTGNSANSANTGNSVDDSDTANTGDSVNDGDTADSVDDGDTADTGDSVDDGDTANTGDSVDDGDTANTGNSVDDGDTAEPTCGNGAPDIGETCEPTDTKECTDFAGAGFESGTATCKSDCTEWIKTDCDCADGYVMDGDGICVDYDECAVDNGGCDQVCTNNTGGRICSCNSGYTLNGDEHTCNDINECTAGTHNCNLTYYTCQNTVGSFTCNDINECASGNGGCNVNATCTNKVGTTPTCSCNNYYTGNGISCSYCNTDAHCNSNCAPCGGSTPKCTATTPHCVECLTDNDCPTNCPGSCNSSNICKITFCCGDGIIRYDDHPTDTTALVILHMDENTGSLVNDSSIHATAGWMDSPSWTTSGKYSNAIFCNGTNTSIALNTFVPPANNFTMEAWVKATTTHEIDIQSTSGTAGDSGQHFLFGPALYGASDAGAGISVGTNGISVYEHAASYIPPLAVYSGTLGTGWNHIAVTYTNKQPRIYLNGVLVKTGYTSLKTNVYASGLIGTGSHGSFTGTVDEVRIYPTALTAAQIRSHYYCDDGNNTNGDGCSSTCHVE